jgi:putative colanic acid biosysnthesis UDP-glucose lipid carrier transferase
MSRRYSQFLELIYLVGDIILLNSAYLVGLVAVGRLDRIFANPVINLMVVVNLIWFFLTKVTRYYESNRLLTQDRIAVKFFRVLLMFILLVAFYELAVKDHYSRQHLAVTIGVFAVLSLIWRLALDTVLKRYRAAGFNYRRIIVVGVNPTSVDFAQQISEHDEYGYRILGFFDDGDVAELERTYHVDVQGSIADVEAYAIRYNIDEIYCALPSHKEDVITDLINFADDHVMRIRIVPEFSQYLYGQAKRLNIEYYGNMPIVTFRQEPLESLGNRAVKRAFDFAFSVFVLLFVFSWLLPIIAIAIKLSSKGPVFFKQKRTGENNEIFTCYKFRTMTVNEVSDAVQATRNDARITPIGRILRKTNLDELPQFFNVLFGHMSVVGPRPHMLKHTEEYSKIIDKFMVRHLIKPGITGMAQVKGYRGDTTDPRLMEKRVQYDVWYLENWSFLLDLKIVFLTVWNMVRGDKNAF